MAYRIKDRVTIITGASKGIGRATALALARERARLVLAARSMEPLYQLQIEIESLGAECMVAETDVNSKSSIDHLIESTMTRFGGIDILVNNAGYGLWGTFEKLPMDEIRKVFETNLFGAIALAQLVIPMMKERGGGQIINVESVVGLRALPGSSGYCASKHALHAFSESMRVELSPHDIHVCSFCPGLTLSDFSANKVEIDFHKQFPRRWSMPTDKCAAILVKAIKGKKRQVVTTWNAKTLHCLQRISPRIIDWIMQIGQRLKMAP